MNICFYIFTEKVHQYDAQCIITGGLFTSIYLSDEIFDYFSCFTVSKGRVKIFSHFSLQALA